jgi:Ca2+-binding EF-hand superfamily protein
VSGAPVDNVRDGARRLEPTDSQEEHTMLGVSSSTGINYSAESFTEMAALMLKKTDTNGDGSIDISEFEAGAPQGPPPGAPEGGSGPDLKELYSKVDADGDGKLSEAEFTAFLKQMEEGKGKPPAGPKGDIGSTSSSEDAGSSLISDLYAASQDMADGTISKDSFIKVIAEMLKESRDQVEAYGATGAGVQENSAALVDKRV